MRSPFPGMDPYLETPALWPDVHNSLIAAIRDALAPRLAPLYYVGLERRVYLLSPDLPVFVGRPDIALTPHSPAYPASPLPLAEAAVLEVDVPMLDEASESYLEIREVPSGKVVTIVEVLSPVNKLNPDGREKYEDKRVQVFNTRTNLVEIDLLRAGEPMPIVGQSVISDYRILVARGRKRPHAQLYAFNVRQPIPAFSLPLRPGEQEPEVDLNIILHELYARVRFDLLLDYAQPPTPPLREEDVEWARELIKHTPPDEP